MKKKLCVILLALVFGGAATVWYQSRPTEEMEPETAIVDTPITSIAPDQRSDRQKLARAEQLNAEASRTLRFDQDPSKLQNNPLDRSELSEMALLLDDPSIGDGQAMDAVYSLLSSLRSTAYQGSYPIGLNVEVTNALLGDNPIKVGVLPIDSPRINENGELVDSRGTPFWFHSQSSVELTITSAGPDRLLHTEDDVIYPPNEN
ncbi:hypothetical protein [Rubritalea sp.]|uniref:hypothetical protein n=1 Tax=Rubritalea sp. TaxID=2109375 RepID=UPI003EF6623F